MTADLNIVLTYQAIAGKAWDRLYKLHTILEDTNYPEDQRCRIALEQLSEWENEEEESA